MISENSIVSIHYKLTDLNGHVLDSSEGLEPLTYMQNCGGLLPALERELEGREVGDRLTVTIGYMDAYGERHEELVQELDLAAFGGQPLSVGMQFKAKGKAEESQLITVIEVHQNTAIIDANHPLAGKDLIFDVGIVGLREPTVRELEIQAPDSTAHISSDLDSTPTE